MTDMPPPEGEPIDTTSAYDAAYGTSDTIETAPAPRGRRGLVIGASAAVLAVLAGAAVYASTMLSGGGRQPDELVPKSAFAYAKVDLDPAAGQKLAARSFFQHFPKVKGKLSGEENTFEQVLEALVSDNDVDYTTDIKPWFDKRAAAAAFPGSGSTVVPLSVLRSKDDAKARTSMEKLAAKSKNDDGGNGFAYAISKGYVVISDSQAHVDLALKEAEQASLRDNDVYRKDVDTLSGDQVGTAWLDIQPTFRAALASVPQGGLLPTGVADRFKGRVVAGLHFASDYVEVEAKAYGVDEQLFGKGTDPAVLKGLPATTVAALSMNDLAGKIQAGLGSTGFNPGDVVDGYLEGTGLTFTDDILPLLGDQTVLALGSAFSFSDDLKVALVSAVKNAEQAQASGKKVVAALQQMGVPADFNVTGNTFYLAVPDGYADELAKSGGGLGESAKFTKAVGSLGTPSMVLYVDLEKFLSAEPGSDEAAFRAFGSVSGFADGSGYSRMRLTVG